MTEQKETPTVSAQKLIGQKASWTPPQGAIAFEVVIADARVAYGKVRYLIDPVAGVGQMWVINGIQVYETN